MQHHQANGEHRAQGHIPGEAGLWILIFGEMSFFAALFGSFLYYRNADIAGFTASQAMLSKPLGLANTIVLLSSSLFVAMAVRATAGARGTTASRLFAAGLLCAIAFIALKGAEYHALIGHGIGIDSDMYFAFYFALTGLHLVHVVIGSVLLGIVARSVRHATAKPSHFALIESAGCFWHMVDLLWIVIFALLYLVE